MTLPELITRVEAGETGVSIRESVALMLGWRQEICEMGDTWLVTPERKSYIPAQLPAWDTSIDAQAALPAKISQVWSTAKGHWIARANTAFGSEGRAPTEPAARLAALLRAMGAGR